jgi:hypothetical protein
MDGSLDRILRKAEVLSAGEKEIRAARKKINDHIKTLPPALKDILHEIYGDIARLEAFLSAVTEVADKIEERKQPEQVFADRLQTLAQVVKRDTLPLIAATSPDMLHLVLSWSLQDKDSLIEATGRLTKEERADFAGIVWEVLAKDD